MNNFNFWSIFLTSRTFLWIRSTRSYFDIVNDHKRTPNIKFEFLGSREYFNCFIHDHNFTKSLVNLLLFASELGGHSNLYSSFGNILIYTKFITNISHAFGLGPAIVMLTVMVIMT